MSVYFARKAFNMANLVKFTKTTKNRASFLARLSVCYAGLVYQLVVLAAKTWQCDAITVAALDSHLKNFKLRFCVVFHCFMLFWGYLFRFSREWRATIVVVGACPVGVCATTVDVVLEVVLGEWDNLHRLVSVVKLHYTTANLTIGRYY